MATDLKQVEAVRCWSYNLNLLLRSKASVGDEASIASYLVAAGT